MEDGRDDNRPLPRTMLRNRHVLLSALKPAVMAVLMVVVAFAPSSTFSQNVVGKLLVILIPPAGAAVVAYCILEWWNGRTTISDEGLDVTDWRGREVHLLWADVRAMWLGIEKNSEWLKIELPDDGRKPQMVNLLTRPRGAGDLQQVRDAIITRARLTEAEPAKTFWPGTKKRVWRRAGMTRII